MNLATSSPGPPCRKTILTSQAWKDGEFRSPVEPAEQEKLAACAAMTLGLNGSGY